VRVLSGLLHAASISDCLALHVVCVVLVKTLFDPRDYITRGLQNS